VLSIMPAVHFIFKRIYPYFFLDLYKSKVKLQISKFVALQYIDAVAYSFFR